MVFRETTVIVLETSRTHVRAVLGIPDLLKTPAVDIPARVGLRRTQSGVDNPEQTTNGKQVAENGDASIPQQQQQQTSTSSAVNAYLVGSQLDEALAAGQDIIVSWPFADGDVRDWTQAEAIWKHVLFKELQIRRAQNESPVLMSIAPGLARSTYERICQIFFERFNVPGFAIMERPMAQLYAANSLSGVVVDIGQEITDVTPVYEGFIVHCARSATPLGVHHCQHYLAHILRSNQSVTSAFSPPHAPIDPATLHLTLIELVKDLLEKNLIKAPANGQIVPEDEGVTDIAAVLIAGKEKAVIESGMRRKATAKASAAEQARAREIEAMDLVTVEFRGHSLTIGKERHRFCEPLFDPSLMNAITSIDLPRMPDSVWPLQDVISHAVGQTEIDVRQHIWAGLFITGELTKNVKGIGGALQSRLAPFILSNPDQQTDFQTRYIRVLTVPDYFAEYRDKGDGLAAFLGTCIVGKMIFNENPPKSLVVKADYASKGPRAVIEMAPALL